MRRLKLPGRKAARMILVFAMLPLLLSVGMTGAVVSLDGSSPPTSDATGEARGPASSASGTDRFGRIPAGFEPVLANRGRWFHEEARPKAEPTPTMPPDPTGTPSPSAPTLTPGPIARLDPIPPAYRWYPAGFYPSVETVYVRLDVLNLREQPTVSSLLLHKLAYAEQLTRIAVGSTWSMVRTRDGFTGYVMSKNLSMKKPAPKKPPVSAATLLRRKVVAQAKKYLGVTYTLNTASPTRGFDCSGLVWYCYGQVGIAVPRSTGPYMTLGTSVKLASILPGDILCWDHRNDGVRSVTHVGIYVGNGMMIHASSSHDEVRYQNVYTYSETLVTIRRVIR